jgi:hypothetical protein
MEQSGKTNATKLIEAAIRILSDESNPSEPLYARVSNALNPISFTIQMSEMSPTLKDSHTFSPTQAEWDSFIKKYYKFLKDNNLEDRQEWKSIITSVIPKRE